MKNKLFFSLHFIGVNSLKAAQLTGVDDSLVSRLTRGLYKKDSPSAHRVCEMLGIDPTWAFTDWKIGQEASKQQLKNYILLLNIYQ